MPEPLADRIRELASGMDDYALDVHGEPVLPWAEWADNLRALADEVGALTTQNSVKAELLIEYHARIETLEALLRIARCPNTDCHDGAIPHGPDPDGHWGRCDPFYRRRT